MPSSFGDVAFWAAVVCCTLAQLLIFHSTLRSTPAKSSPPAVPDSLAELTPRRATGSRPSELAWVTLPALALAILFVLTWREMHPRESGSARARPASEVSS